MAAGIAGKAIPVRVVATEAAGGRTASDMHHEAIRARRHYSKTTMVQLPKKLERALDALLKTVNTAESEDSDIILDAMHVLAASGRTPNVWREKANRSE